MSTAESQEPVSEPEGRLFFPPFPLVPEGVTIVPFREFKERGIQLFATDHGDDVERDGLGIPTVELRVRHDADVCKTGAKKRKRAKVQQKVDSAATPGVRKEWWEQWMEAEDLRGGGTYNPSVVYICRNVFRLVLTVLQKHISDR